MKILLLIINILLVFSISSASENTHIIYNYETCNSRANWGFKTVSGAVIEAIGAKNELLPVNCTTTLRSASADEVFLVQLTNVDIRRHDNSCIDSLTVIGVDSYDRQLYTVLDKFCGTKNDLPVKNKFYSKGRILFITWSRAAANRTRDRSKFSITLTSISRPPVVCEVETHLRCSNDDCMALELLCDGVKHCGQGEDEFRCPENQGLTGDAHEPMLPPPAHPQTTEMPPDGTGDLYLYMPLVVVLLFTIIMLCLILIGRKATRNRAEELEAQSDSLATNGSYGNITLTTASLVANFTLVTSTTTEGILQNPKTTAYVPLATTSSPIIGWEVGSPDLISVAIIGSVFAVVLIVCIVLGCREKKSQETTEAARSTSQINSNPGYSDSNGPPTPPPTYAFIERQISYVSDISQRSSQISVPPDYDEALDMPDSPSGRRRSRRRSRLSRSSTGGSSGRRRNRPRFPFFRSLSAQDSMSRYRARNSAPVELVSGPRHSQLASDSETLPSVREHEQHHEHDQDDGNTSPSDDNVFESPSSTLETRVQVEADGETTESPATAAGQQQHSSRDSSPENQRLLQNVGQSSAEPGSTESIELSKQEPGVTFY